MVTGETTQPQDKVISTVLDQMNSDFFHCIHIYQIN